MSFPKFHRSSFRSLVWTIYAFFWKHSLHHYWLTRSNGLSDQIYHGVPWSTGESSGFSDIYVHNLPHPSTIAIVNNRARFGSIFNDKIGQPRGLDRLGFLIFSYFSYLSIVQPMKGLKFCQFAEWAKKYDILLKNSPSYHPEFNRLIELRIREHKRYLFCYPNFFTGGWKPLQ